MAGGQHGSHGNGEDAPLLSTHNSSHRVTHTFADGIGKLRKRLTSPERLY